MIDNLDRSRPDGKGGLAKGRYKHLFLGRRTLVHRPCGPRMVLIGSEKQACAPPVSNPVFSLFSSCLSPVISARILARMVNPVHEDRAEKIAKFRRTDYWKREFPRMVRYLQTR